MTFMSQVRSHKSMRVSAYFVSVCSLPCSGRQTFGENSDKQKKLSTETGFKRKNVSLSESFPWSMATKRIALLGKISYRPIGVTSFSCTSNGFSLSSMATMATYKVPKVENENNVSLTQTIETLG